MKHRHLSAAGTLIWSCVFAYVMVRVFRSLAYERCDSGDCIALVILAAFVMPLALFVMWRPAARSWLRHATLSLAAATLCAFAVWLIG